MFPNPDQDPTSPYSRTDLMRFLEDRIRQAGGDPDALLQGSNHPYACTCQTCWSWWKQMGLGEELDPPFTQQELDAPSYEAAIVLWGQRKRGGGGLL